MKKVLALVLAMTMLVGLAACGGSGSSQPVEPAKKEHGNEIVVGIPQDLGDSLDPYQMSSAGTREILTNVFEGLYKPNSDGDYVPAIASSCEISEDGLTYTFHLNEGVTFHNGKTLTNADLEYSFAKCAETTLDSSLPKFFANADITVNGKGQVIVQLKEAMSDIFAYISLIYIIPADYADQLTAPIGTGPYKFVSRSVQENVILEKFEEYYGEKAKIDKITCKVFEDGTALVTALNAGAIDFATHLSLDQVAGVGSDYQVIEGTTNVVQALYINNAAKPFDDIRVRQALCYAVNVDDVLQLVANGHGTKLGTSIYPSFKKYFDSSLVGYYKYDVEKAKSLLAEAGYPNGFDMTITVPSVYPIHVNTALVIAEQLKAAGINAQVQEVEWNTWLTDVYSNRDFETTVSGFDASTLTANALLERWTSGHKKNMINFANSEYDEYMTKANSTTDEAERTKLFIAASRVLTENAANVYIQDAAEFTVMNGLLDGYQSYPLYRINFASLYYTDL